MYKNVLIALKDSPAAGRALHRAIALAGIDNGDLFVVSIDEGLPVFESIVWAVSDNLAKILEEDRKNLYRHLLDDAQKQAQSHSIHLHSTLAEGKPANGILEAVQQVHADLLVFGISPHFGIGGLILGGTAVELARRSRCDVLGVH
jgi:nucleotide-binding universal stress UspA family protein